MSTFAQIETLKAQLEQVRSDLAEVKLRSWDARKSLFGARLRSLYYRGSLALRRPSPNYSMWDAGVLTIGPAVAMIAALILFNIVGLPGGLIFWLVVLAAVVTFAALSLMLSYPSTSALPKLIADERFLSNEMRETASQLDLETNTLQKQFVATRSALDELLESDRLKREELLKKNWKAMLEEAWRKFVGEVFLALGGDVEKTGDERGADMVVNFGELRIAVLTKSNVPAVTGKDVEQILAAQSQLKCDRVAIITNHRFARSAEELAEANGVYLIGMQDVPSFVMGSNLELLRSP